MHPIPGVVEKNVIQSALNYVRNFLHRDRDQQKRIESLETQLAEERSGKLAFEKLTSELECRPEDDHMYWKKDHSAGPFCPTCLHSDQKLIPLINGNREGAFYCNIHQQCFETEELRQRIRTRVRHPRPPSRFGPHSWMGS